MRAIRFSCSTELLRDMLHMPPTSQIVGAEMDSRGSFNPHSVSFTVWDSELPDVETPPEVTPTITAVHEVRQAAGSAKGADEFVWDWGIKS